MGRNGGLRIAIDARYLSHGLVGGVHTYLRNLSQALLRASTCEQYVFWTDAKAPFDLSIEYPQLDVRCLPWSNARSSVWNDLRIGKNMAADHADIAHFPANYGLAPADLPRLVTIHDAINLLPLTDIVRGHKKSLDVIGKMTYLHVMTRRSVRQKPYVVTVSEYSKSEILRQTHLPEDRVYVVHSAHGEAFKPAPCEEVAETRARYQLRERVVLADAIKNPDVVLAAYRELPASLRERTSLVFFSRRTAPDSVQESSGRGEATVILRPELDELVRLFSLADVFVFPSLYEGFGLPALEAMACGTPVIASNIGSLPEVLGPAGYVVGVDDYQEIAGTITRMLSFPVVHAIQREAALTRASEFSWDRSARRMLDIYRDVYDRARYERAALR